MYQGDSVYLGLFFIIQSNMHSLHHNYVFLDINQFSVALFVYQFLHHVASYIVISEEIRLTTSALPYNQFLYYGIDNKNQNYQYMIVPCNQRPIQIVTNDRRYFVIQIFQSKDLKCKKDKMDFNEPQKSLWLGDISVMFQVKMTTHSNTCTG